MSSIVEFIQTFLHRSQQVDNAMMLVVNRELTHPLMDNLALFMRESIFHIPLYLFLFFIAYQLLGKKAFWWIIAACTLIAITDLLSSQLIKYTFNRIRPCRDPFMATQVRFLAKYCGSNPSFTSSHAMNHFAFAAFAASSFKGISKWVNLLFVWAAIISYSQVYVGVHYPSDVIVGGFMGILLGWMGYGITKQALSLHEPQQ